MSAERLELVPVGVGAAYARPGEVQSCHLVRLGARSVALDLGAGALNLLQRQVAPERLAAVVISHLHPDHLADLLSLRVYMAWGPGRGARLRVLGPVGLRERLVAFAGSDGWDAAFDFEELDPDGGELEVHGIGLRYGQVPHLAPTFAFRVEVGGRSLCYGADCADGPELPELARGCDVLLAECSFGAEAVPEGVPHLNASAAGALATRAGVGRLLLTHCYPEFDREHAREVAAEAFAGPVDWARQGEAVLP